MIYSNSARLCEDLQPASTARRRGKTKACDVCTNKKERERESTDARRTRTCSSDARGGTGAQRRSRVPGLADFKNTALC